MKEGSWDFGHYKLRITEPGKKEKLVKIVFQRDANKPKSEYFLKNLYYEFNLPHEAKATTYKFKTSRLEGLGCSQNPQLKYSLKIDGTKTEIDSQAGTSFQVPSAASAELLAKIENDGNCDHIDYSVSLERE